MTKATQQVVNQAFLQDENLYVVKDLGVARAHMDTYLHAKEDDLKNYREQLQVTKGLYDKVIYALMGTKKELNEAGLPLFMQAASEQLAIIHFLEAKYAKPGSTKLEEITHKYCKHLKSTFADMKAKRLKLMYTEEGMGYYLKDEYQLYRSLPITQEAEYKMYHDMMALHYDIEYGNPIELVQTWESALMAPDLRRD